MSVIQIAIVVILAVVIGIFMGIIGGGGGGIYVVVLMVLLHQNVKTAATCALVLSTIMLSGAAWQYWRKKQLRIDYFIVLSIVDIAGTMLGYAIMNRINENVLKIIIFCVLVLSGMSSLLKIKPSKKENMGIADVKEKLHIAAPIGLISGLITGTTGLSGSTMITSYLIGLLDFSPYLAVGTTTLVSFVGNLLSIAVFYLSSIVFHTPGMNVNIEVLLTFGIGSAVGAVFGAKLTTKINRKVLTAVLAAGAIVPAIYLVIK